VQIAAIQLQVWIKIMTGVERFCMWIRDGMFNDSQGPNKIYRNTILSKFRQLWAHTMCPGKTSPINMAEEKTL